MQVLKDEVKQRILKSSRQEFHKSGFEKTSMRIIASDAKMTVGNLYRYYKNKEDLYGAIIESLCDAIKVFKMNLPSEPEKRLHSLIENCKKLQKEYRLEWLILFEGSQGTQYKKIADDIHATFCDTLKTIIEKNGRRSDVAVPITSAILYGLNTILRGDGEDVEEISNAFISHMMADIPSFTI